MILFEADEVLSRRYRPAWMALSFASGGVNAGAYFACERTVTHVTGIVSRIGMAPTLLRSAEFMLVLGAFVVGAAASVLLIDGRFHQKLRPLYTTPLRLTSLVLTFVAVVGWRGAFSVFGETVDLTADFVLLALLAFAIGLQNAAVSTMTPLMVRTTHMTGHATDLGMGLALLGFTAGEHRAHAVRGTLLRGGKIAAFAAGGFAAAELSRAGYLVFLVPALVVALVNEGVIRGKAERWSPPEPATEV